LKLVKLGFLAALAAGGAAEAQIPDRFTNLQLLPADSSRGALVQVMRGFASALGVRCEHCHVGEGGPMLKNMDFASDDKEPKRVARLMMRMVQAVNDEHLAKLGRTNRVTVECATCHRGVARPEAIQDIVARVMAESGIEAALARYRELREQYQGRGSFNFDQGPLNALAEKLLAQGKPTEALALLELNAEFHPRAAWPRHLMGEAHLASGEREKARAAFEKALELDPGNPLTKKRLEELVEKKEP
jgi:tetratricopeptide (TPR) repeat protein